MMSTKLLLPMMIFATGCGPLTSEKQDSPNRDHNPAVETELAKSSLDSKTKGHSDHSDSPGKKQAKSKVNTPKQSPTQSPSQSPHQGKVFGNDAPPMAITSISTSGKGCPTDSVGSNISDDRQAFTLLFDDFFVGYDPDDSSILSSLSCTIDLEFEIPSGWRFAIVTLDYRGFADLADGDHVTFDTNLAFTNSNSVSLASVIDGETQDDFEIREEIPVSSRHWHGCSGRTDHLSIDLNVSIDNNSDEPNEVNVDSIDGEMTQKHALIWKRCS